MRLTFGEISRQRTKRLLEALLAFGADLHAQELRRRLAKNAQVSLSPDRLQVRFRGTLENLADIVNFYETLVGKDESEVFLSHYVKLALEHLNQTIGVYEDKRRSTQGAKLWNFVVTFWYSLDDPQRNLERFEAAWAQAVHENSLCTLGTEEPSLHVMPSVALRTQSHLSCLSFSAFLNEKRRYFTGREWLFKEIEARCIQGNEPALLITGDPGSGKSAIVAEFVHRNPGGCVLAFHCCQADTEQTLKPGLFVRSVAAQIAEQLPDYAVKLREPSIAEVLVEDNCEADPGSAFEIAVLDPLQSLGSCDDLIRFILVDGLDEAIRGKSVRRSIVGLLASRLHRFPRSIRLIATSRRESEVLQRLGRAGVSEIKAEDPRNSDDIRVYIAQRLSSKNLADKLDKSGFDIQTIQNRLQSISCGNFLYIQQALEGIENNCYNFESVDQLPPGLSGLYLNFFERYFPDDFSSAKKLLEVIMASQEPLTADQLAEVTEMDLENALIPLLRCLESYLPVRKYSDCIDRYAFYHKSVPDWLSGQEARGTLYYVSIPRGHGQIANYFLQFTDQKFLPFAWKQYLEQYAPLHLLEASMGAELARLITQLPEHYRRISVVTAVQHILDKGEIDICLQEFFYYLANLEQWSAVWALAEIALSLMDCGLYALAEQAASLPQQHPYAQQVTLILKLKQSALESQTQRVIELAGRLLKFKDLPDELKGLAQYHLAEGLRVAGKHLPAMKSYKEAVTFLQPHADFFMWMHSQCAIADLEYVFGRLPEALDRLSDLLQKALARQSYAFCATVHRLIGQIQHISADYEAAEISFQQSLELFTQVKQPVRIVEALNSLANTQIYNCPTKVNDLLERSRELAHEIETWLELGKTYLIEAEYKLVQGYPHLALDIAMEAEQRLKSVNYGSGIARSRMLIAQAAIAIQNYELALSSALEANQYFKSEQIYPSLRFLSYDLVITAANQLDRKDEFVSQDNPSKISFLENFSNIKPLTESHSRRNL